MEIDDLQKYSSARNGSLYWASLIKSIPWMIMFFRLVLLGFVILMVGCSGGSSSSSSSSSASRISFQLPTDYCSEISVLTGSLVGLEVGDQFLTSTEREGKQMGGQLTWDEFGSVQSDAFFIVTVEEDFDGTGIFNVSRNSETVSLIVTIPLQTASCTLGSITKPANLEFGDFVNFESGQVRPLAITPAGDKLLAVNTPDARLEIYDIVGDQLSLAHSVDVGLDPVAVAIRDDNEAWVVNHLSDSISVISLQGVPHVTRTIQVGDEPRDIVFASEGNTKAFITTAHRGQNHPSFEEADLTTPGIGRADVWVFDATSEVDLPINILSLFADTPRALAVSPDKSTVYAAAFMSGNQTTVLSQFDAGDGKAAPGESLDGTPQPSTGLIVKYDGAQWIDEVGTDWSASVKFSLPDYDVFSIDASLAEPAELQRFSGVGTTLFNMAVNPLTGVLYVSNTDARNEVRFEGTSASFSSVRGHIAENRITVIKDGVVTPRHLNKHIDFSATVSSPISATEKAKSLSQPMEMVVSADGNRLYVVAHGSNKLAWFNTAELEDNSFVPNAENQLVLSGGGPSGLVLNADGSRLYVMTRFNNAISIIQTSDHSVVGEVSLFNPEPALVSTGRPILYDADLTSDNGANSCGTCHLFGDMDGLAWDLGDPSGEVVSDPNTYVSGTEIVPGGPKEFHPLKGPMTTQTNRGLKGQGTQHWRGDRTGLNPALVNGAIESIEAAAFKEFNPAFVGLVGRGEELSNAQMQAYTDFTLEIVPPPNPLRALDNSLTTAQQSGSDTYFNVNTDSGLFSCHDCHVLTPALGFFGTNGESTKEGGRVSQNFKVPHERNLYQKVGRFGVSLSEEQVGSEQIRGFGFLHDGSVDTLDDFFHSAVFSFHTQQLMDEVVSFIFALDSNLAPIVGQQVTFNNSNSVDTEITEKLDLMLERAAVTGVREECDLIARGVIDGERRGYLLNQSGTFTSDLNSEVALTRVQLISLINASGEALTFTCVPPGSGFRMALDRDRDGILNRDES